ncbi:50S ribosomal protein L44e [Candidatus Woesearchaeota archaeon]|nr:50S ribosomal protein L44e [Candidatus Woesearchaeota archaeon]MBW2978583.1 50S ribosomal protein L44e [Candidatus Woesearchaeota archaeon]
MKLPKIRKTYCPKCKKHTEHKVAEAKKRTMGSAHPMSYGGKKRAKRRGRMGKGSTGRYSRPAASKFKMTGKKQTKKIDLRYTCTVCKKSHTVGKAWRAKKVEFK